MSALYPDAKALMMTLEAEISRLTAELEAARKDAQRYRWLRNKKCSFDVLNDYGDPFWEEGLDAAIDAAMKEGA